MNNFRFYNPVEILFGKGSIAQLDQRIPKKAKVMLLYGGGSIKANGVYDQVIKALKKRKVVEFGGIEANPDYSTLMKAVDLAKKKDVTFLLAVGGGSVIDGTKFISVAWGYRGSDAWDILTKDASTEVKKALPVGVVLTLPATSSEFNDSSVVSRRDKKLKLSFKNDLAFPRFSILDPEVTRSLPEFQLRNGLVDAYAHVIEQYITYPVDAIVQDRQAEALLLSLIEMAPRVLQMDPIDMDARASFMWACSVALNRLIGVGVPQDWGTHGIGHELTALYGLAHAESLAVVLPYLLWYKRDAKREKLLQYGARVFGIKTGKYDDRIEQTILATSRFFESVGMPTTLTSFGVDPDEASKIVQKRLAKRNFLRGEHKDIDANAAADILRLSR